MGAGALRERIEVLEEITAGDGMGGQTVAWDVKFTLAARIKPVSGDEKMHGQQVQATMRHRVVIRYRSGVDTVQRIRWGTRVFNILAVTNPDERRKYLELLCEEGAV